MIYDLPTTVELGGSSYEIRSDYRAILDICAALSDPDLDGQERAVVCLGIFYPSAETIPPEHFEEAIKKCLWFINCGLDDTGKKAPRLMDWEQDFPYIVAPINRVFGKEIRSVEYLHWWTFISCYYEIGECLFAQIVRIRNLKRRGKKLDKADQDWYKQNCDLVDFKVTYTEAEQDTLKQWGV